MATSLPVVCSGVRGPTIDLVCIPGLPELNPQYKPKDHNPWLRSVLSRQVPGARIMAFHYEFPKSPSPSWGELLEQVNGLLYGLIHRREDSLARPILFICHSFGAMILKRALLDARRDDRFRRHIYDCTVGILFLGCLHDESHASFDEACLQCAAVEFRCIGSKKIPAFESLRNLEKLKSLKETMEEFRALRATWAVRSFYEMRRTVYQTHRIIADKSDILCPGMISRLGWESERTIEVDCDHLKLTSFPERTDEFLDVLIDNIADIIKESCPSDTMPLLHSNATSADVDDWQSIAAQSLQTVISEPLGDGSIASLTIAPLQTAKLPCFVITPHQENTNFIGRQDLLKDIFEALRPGSAAAAQRTFALCGLGGMGKTQIALRFAFEHRHEFDAIMWAHTDNRTKLSESFARFAVELGLWHSASDDQAGAKSVLDGWLASTNSSWLLIFDNADGGDKNELLKEFCPTVNDRGSILITSRDGSLVNQFGGKELRELDSESAVHLLTNLTKFGRARFTEKAAEQEHLAAMDVVRRIGFLPLGIYQAAKIIMDDGCSITEFLEAYNNRDLIEESEKVELATQDDTNYHYSLRTVWNMNFERLDDSQQRMLTVMAFLDPDRIPLMLFDDVPSASLKPGFDFLRQKKQRHRSKRGLVQSSLVYQNEDIKEVSMHRLVQASCHLRMTGSERRERFAVAVKLVKARWPVPDRSQVHNPSLWDEQQALLPHVESLCSHYVNYLESGISEDRLIPRDSVDWDFAQLLYEAGWFCYERGLLSQVAHILKPAEQYCLEHVDEGGNKLLADIYGGLGSLDTESNQFQGAYNNFEKQWIYIEKAIDTGELQRPTIWEVFGLGRRANGLHGLHRYEEAEQKYRECLKLFETVPGDQKIFTTHLATCLWLQNRLSEAEETVCRIIKDRNDISNFRTGQALFSLGNIQLAQAAELEASDRTAESATKYIEAFETHKQAHYLYDATLGPKHHKTADALHKIGWHLHRVGKYDEALAKLRQALRIYQGHPTLFKNEIARTTYKIGCLHQDMGHMHEGRKEIETAEKTRQALIPAEDWEPARDESAYDEIVMFWTR